ncbi:type VII secretion integral membrane protein EccD [Catenuloplanes japonicus]|uniref:type VII secretion integral membrane protein EccD n=1 Tax=Catenuloplanes japonicus TaxID=33876 RepID=UPI0005255D76|nr:type VII secretion integral membrane protein EccD [Catenuloplanes japonicus]
MSIARITVVGPVRRADLAVPVTTTVAAMLPSLLDKTSDGTHGDRAWVLQRLGEKPFALSGTPESLDWLEGEELHLRPAENPLPELDFDDIADGVATIVNRRDDRWQPEYRRTLFLVLSAITLGALAHLVSTVDVTAVRAGISGGLATVLLGAALICGRRQPDTAFALLCGAGAAGFGALAAGGIAPAAGAVTAVAAILLLGQRTVTPHIRPAPVLTAGLTAVAVLIVAGLRAATGLGLPGTAAVVAALLFLLVVQAPRLAVKLSRLRGPQLPKSGAEMTFDIAPEDAALVAGRTADADTYLTVAMLTTALLLPVLLHHTLAAPGWAGVTFVSLLTGAVLLRVRAFGGLWQRIGLVTAGTVGTLMVVAQLSGSWRYPLIAALAVLVIPLVMAAARPWPRRMLPFWEYTARFLDVATGVAVLPVLGQLVGVYAWARGLAG